MFRNNYRKTRVLFIGTHLSKVKGTKNIAERLYESTLADSRIEVVLVSKHSNRILRICDIAVATLLRRVDKIHIDVFSGKAFLIASVSSFIGKIRGIPIIMTIHGGMFIEFEKEKSQMIKRTLSRANYLQTPSKWIQENLYHLGFDIKYLPNSIDFKRFSTGESTCKKIDLLWIRAFDEIYNPYLAIDILKGLKIKDNEARLTMIGPDKGIRSNVELYIENLGLLGDVDIVGSVNNEDLKGYFSTHKIFLNTTKYESFGMAVLEAAASKIPIVSTSVGELPYIWKHRVDICFAKDADAFVEEIGFLSKNKDKREKIINNALNKARTYDNSKIHPEWRQLLLTKF